MKLFSSFLRSSKILLTALTILLLHSTCSEKEFAEFHNPLANPDSGPAAGNPNGNSPIPAEAGLENVSNPDHIIGDGTPESVTAQAFIDAVALGGTIVFNTYFH